MKHKLISILHQNNANQQVNKAVFDTDQSISIYLSLPEDLTSPVPESITCMVGPWERKSVSYIEWRPSKKSFAFAFTNVNATLHFDFLYRLTCNFSGTKTFTFHSEKCSQNKIAETLATE